MAPPGQAPAVLFVDDEQAVLEALKRSLRGALQGVDVYYQTSPRAALDFVKAHKPSVVVSDIRMPDMNGLDLVSNIKACAPDTKTILLTGTGDLNAALTAINDAGVFRFYTKPCPTPVLLEGIEAALCDGAQQADTRSGFSSSIGTAALNHLKLAIIIVDADCRIVFTNSAGAHFFAESGFLFWGSDDRPRTSSPSETQDLHRLLTAAAQGDLETLGDGVLAVQRPDGGRPLCLAISRLKEGAPANHAIIFISDPDSTAVISTQSIAQLFGLTGAEAKLTRALALGDALQDAAVQSNVTLSTARTYLKQIFQKTDTNRQSELIRLVLSARQSG